MENNSNFSFEDALNNYSSSNHSNGNGYTKDSLLDGEKIICSATWSGIQFVLPILMILLGIILLIAGADDNDSLLAVGIPILILGILILILLVWIRKTNEIVITNKRIIVKSGIIIRAAFELKIEMLESINVYQGILGRIFGYGMVMVCGVGASRQRVFYINDPLEFRQHFFKEIYYKAELKKE